MFHFSCYHLVEIRVSNVHKRIRHRRNYTRRAMDQDKGSRAYPIKDQILMETSSYVCAIFHVHYFFMAQTPNNSAWNWKWLSASSGLESDHKFLISQLRKALVLRKWGQTCDCQTSFCFPLVTAGRDINVYKKQSLITKSPAFCPMREHSTRTCRNDIGKGRIDKSNYF